MKPLDEDLTLCEFFIDECESEEVPLADGGLGRSAIWTQGWQGAWPWLLALLGITVAAAAILRYLWWKIMEPSRDVGGPFQEIGRFWGD